MNNSRAVSDVLLAAGVASFAAAAVLFFVLVSIRAVPESSAPLIEALTGLFGALAGFFLALRQWVNRDSERL